MHYPKENNHTSKTNFYFSIANYLIIVKKKDDQWMFPGTYEYPFNFRLPLDLPETLDSSRYATISYTVKASVYMNLGRKSDSIEEGFYLQAMPDTRIPKVAEEDLPKVLCNY